MNRIPAALANVWWSGIVRLLPANLLSHLRVAALCLLVVAVSANPCLGAGVHIHFFDRLDPAHVSEALCVTIIGPAWSRQIQINLNTEKSETYGTLTLPEPGTVVVLLHADTVVRAHGQLIRRSSAGMERIEVTGGETFELVVAWDMSPGRLGLRERRTERKPPEPVLPPILPAPDGFELELVPQPKSGLFSGAPGGKPERPRKPPVGHALPEGLKPLIQGGRTR